MALYLLKYPLLLSGIFQTLSHFWDPPPLLFSSSRDIILEWYPSMKKTIHIDILEYIKTNNRGYTWFTLPDFYKSYNLRRLALNELWRLKPDNIFFDTHSHWFWLFQFNCSRQTNSLILFTVHVLTYFWLMFPFYTPWKYQTIKGFLVFSGCIKLEQG